MVTHFTNINYHPSSIWHTSFGVSRAIVFSLDVAQLQLPIQSLLVKCGLLSSGGCTTILMEIHKRGHGHLSPELHTAHWFGVVLLATFHTEDICI